MNKRKRGREKAYQNRKNKNPKDIVYKQVKKDVQKANQRLKSLERHIKTGTWASKNLKNRLSTKTVRAWNKQRIKINENMTITELKAVQKATRQFLTSKTSTYKGIKDVSESTIDALQEQFDLDDTNLTREDYADIYDLFGTSEFKNLAEYLESSDIVALLTDAKEYNMSENQFLEQLNVLLDIEDSDIKTKAKRLYDKLMR